MKKILGFILAFSCILSSAQAQDEQTGEPLLSKRGIAILPETGEWGLGVSANPFLSYLGNFFHGNALQGSPTFTYANNPANNIAVFGKLMRDANTAYRVRFNVNINTDINKAVVAQNELTPDPLAPAFTEDWQRFNTKQIVLTAGLEKRRGKTRLQGVYGGEVVFGLASEKVEYEYGNPITSDFNAPITNNFGNNILTGNAAAAASRKLDENFGTIFLVGARGFIGVEYFFAPKMSIGGEFGYMFGFQTQKRALITSEAWDSTAGEVRETKTDYYDNGGLTSIGVGLDNLSGSINLLFYF